MLATMARSHRATAPTNPKPETATLALSGPQMAVFRDPTRFRVLVAGRRFGKTHEAAVELITAAARKPDSVNWYLAPTYRQAKEVAWRTLKRLAPRPLVHAVNETDLSLWLVNGAQIALRGTEDPDALRGRGLDFAALDEFALMDRHVWTEVVRPMLSDRQGGALFITTPRGFNWAYDAFLKGQGSDPDWKSWQFTTLDGGRVSVEEVDKARSELDPRVFAQEYLASFEALSNRVYSNFVRQPHPAGNLDAGVADPWDGKTGPDLLVGMDFNVHPMSLVIAIRAADECHVLDALEIPTSNTAEAAQELKTRYPKRRIVICPDPSGRARKTSAPVGQTDFTILKDFGFEVRADAAAPPVVDRVNNTQANLLDANGRRRLRIHPRATALLRGLEGQTYKEGTSLIDKTLGLDHICDACDYVLWQEFNLVSRRAWTTFPFEI